MLQTPVDSPIANAVHEAIRDPVTARMAQAPSHSRSLRLLQARGLSQVVVSVVGVRRVVDDYRVQRVKDGFATGLHPVGKALGVAIAVTGGVARAVTGGVADVLPGGLSLVVTRGMAALTRRVRRIVERSLRI